MNISVGLSRKRLKLSQNSKSVHLKSTKTGLFALTLCTFIILKMGFMYILFVLSKRKVMKKTENMKNLS